MATFARSFARIVCSRCRRIQQPARAARRPSSMPDPSSTLARVARSEVHEYSADVHTEKGRQ